MSGKMNLRIDNQEMLHNKVCSVLRAAILKGDFKPGERLVQTDLAELTGVSRMPIREALRTLENEGLVTLEPHKGAVVRSISWKDIMEIYELRALLEPLALKKSMAHFTKTDIADLQHCFQEMNKPSSDDLYVEWNVKFHQLLCNRCQSPRLLGFIKSISRGFAHDTPQIIPGQIEKSNNEHKKIMEAVINGDAEMAANWLRAHIERSGKELLHSLDHQEFYE